MSAFVIVDEKDKNIVPKSIGDGLVDYLRQFIICHFQLLNCKFYFSLQNVPQLRRKEAFWWFNGKLF